MTEPHTGGRPSSPQPDSTAPNPALVPEPEQPQQHDYKVVGPHTVLGHEAGSTFKATIPLEQEKFLIEGGHIKRLKETA